MDSTRSVRKLAVTNRHCFVIYCLHDPRSTKYTVVSIESETILFQCYQDYVKIMILLLLDFATFRQLYHLIYFTLQGSLEEIDELHVGIFLGPQKHHTYMSRLQRYRAVCVLQMLCIVFTVHQAQSDGTPW